ncbi:MAG: beta-lactamase family protein [Candidatus Eremiobacteraeota bacterium]|nr:beta-lactamase family protein [Candidatus Eremiobacteraeota bacterium]
MRRLPSQPWVLVICALSVLLAGCMHNAITPVDTTSLSSYIDSLASQEIQAHKAPGFSLAVLRHGEVIYSKGFGLADIQHHATANSETRYAIGSITKQFTAASILLLSEEHKLTLNDPLSKYFPKFDGAARIKLRNLLGHTSGLHNYPWLLEHRWPTKGTIAPSSILTILQQDKLDFKPGSRYAYSNSNYAVLAAIVAQVSGEPYPEFVERRIFKPLGMHASGSGEVFSRREHTAPGYSTLFGLFLRQQFLSLDLFYGAGSIVSTVNDMAKWDKALLRGEVLSKASFRMMITNGKLNDGHDSGYGMGFVPSSQDGHPSAWHNGLTPGAGGYCFNIIYPDDDLAVVILSNGSDFNGEPEQLATKIFRYIKDKK